MKRLVAIGIFFLILLACLLIIFGGCEHEWTEADCVYAKICTLCERTEGKPLGHDWKEADCEHPKTCTRCEAVTGPALGHQWEEATCEDAKICSRCALTNGEPLGHDWITADCENPNTCANCGAQYGEPKGHHWRENDSRTRKYCRTCGVQALGSLTLEQAFPAGELRFTDGCFVMDEFDYLDMYEKALNEAGFQYWHEDEPLEEGIPVYELVEMTTGNVITVSFAFDENFNYIHTIYAYTDISVLTEEELGEMWDVLNISFDVAHGAMTKRKWSQLEGADYMKTQDESMFFCAATVDGLGYISLMEVESKTYGIMSVADLSSVSIFASAME